MRKLTTLALSALLLLGAAGCGDLVVPNENNPDAERALRNPADVESLISGSWVNWWYNTNHYDFAHPMLSTMSFQHSAYPANFGMVHYSAIPRVSTGNDPAHQFYNYFGLVYTYLYRAIAATNDGLRALAPIGTVELTGSGVDRNRQDRARAFARYVQGISYGYLAMMFTNGPIVDETTDLINDEVVFVDYNDLLDAALGYLDEAISIASGSDFEVPNTWIYTPQNISSDEFAQIASSYKARLRAAVARTPAERAAVNWNAVLSEIDAGITSDFAYDHDGPWPQYQLVLLYTLFYQWSQMPYWVHGMADQSGKYQEWMALPTAQKHPDLPNGGPFIMQTPDLRFPQGATREAQLADQTARMAELKFCATGPGCTAATHSPGGQWGQPGRGTWRWSYYRDARDASYTAYEATVADISMHEMRLLAAEAHYRLGNLGQAADLVNVTRTAAGLNATDAAGTNTSCVPKLPNGQCGDLLEMIKWEKRLEAAHNNGFMASMFYFEGRGWGDLHEGTILSGPVPAIVAELEGQPIVNVGGGLDWSAPVGTYGY
jgi:hypothetical protein